MTNIVCKEALKDTLILTEGTLKFLNHKADLLYLPSDIFKPEIRDLIENKKNEEVILEAMQKQLNSCGNYFIVSDIGDITTSIAITSDLSRFQVVKVLSLVLNRTAANITMEASLYENGAGIYDIFSENDHLDTIDINKLFENCTEDDIKEAED